MYCFVCFFVVVAVFKKVDILRLCVHLIFLKGLLGFSRLLFCLIFVVVEKMDILRQCVNLLFVFFNGLFSFAFVVVAVVEKVGI